MGTWMRLVEMELVELWSSVKSLPPTAVKPASLTTWTWQRLPIHPLPPLTVIEAMSSPPQKSSPSQCPRH